MAMPLSKGKDTVVSIPADADKAMKLELIWRNYLGTEYSLGVVGLPTGKFDAHGEQMRIGDLVTFKVDNKLKSTRVCEHWLTSSPQLIGFESMSYEIFEKQKLELGAKVNLTAGEVIWVGLPGFSEPDRIIVREFSHAN